MEEWSRDSLSKAERPQVLAIRLSITDVRKKMNGLYYVFLSGAARDQIVLPPVTENDHRESIHGHKKRAKRWSPLTNRKNQKMTEMEHQLRNCMSTYSIRSHSLGFLCYLLA
ncbi:hypothetical protein BaRGS_00012393 [Batillaria attramentaria]|uniref:Uncharacterized protein n=1 Tax=Batillaria attramentaria TaxID=370345 RepID=A0ABD0LB23_9CAEN